ncbi:MAG: hypothetical protein AB1650_04610 [Candidatus Omnitrophota bacterium]
MKTFFKKLLWLAAAAALFFSLGTAASFSQSADAGTSMESETRKLREKEERACRSQAIQETARIYREMVASYKARQIVHAEELSQRLDDLLADPVLPEDFARRIHKKQEAFLKRVYSSNSLVAIDVPVDQVSDDEIKVIQEVIQDSEKVPLNKVKDEEDIIDPGRRKQELKMKKKQESLARKAALKAERLAEKEKRKADALAKKEAGKAVRLAKKKALEAERQARLEKRKLKQTQETVSLSENNAGTETRSEEALQRLKKVDSQLEKIIVEQETKQTVVTRAIASQQKALDLKKDEVERYVRLYQEDLIRMKKELHEEFLNKIESLYLDGLEFFDKKAYQFAYDVLTEVEKLSPDYKATRRYMADLERQLNLNQVQVSPERSSRSLLIEEALDAYLK